jgi:YVTN family beta-propeller protein
MKNRYLSFALLSTCALILSCTTAETPPGSGLPGSGNGAFIMNEGVYPGYGSVSFYNRTNDSVYQNVVSINAKWVTPNDGKVVGNKLYVAVNGNDTIYILNSQSFAVTGRIHIPGGPGFLDIIDSTRGVIANYDGTVCLIDLVHDVVIGTTLPVVTFPGGIVGINGKILVSDEGYYPTYSNIVRVLDGTTLQVIDSIYVGTAPGMIAKGVSPLCFLVCGGVYPAKGKVYTINTTADVLIDSTAVGVGPSDISYLNHSLYVLHGDRVMRLNSIPLSVGDSAFAVRGSGLYYYAMAADASTGDVYVSNVISPGGSGQVEIYTSAGVLRRPAFPVGAFPGSFAFK